MAACWAQSITLSSRRAAPIRWPARFSWLLVSWQCPLILPLTVPLPTSSSCYRSTVLYLSKQLLHSLDLDVCIQPCQDLKSCCCCYFFWVGNPITTWSTVVPRISSSASSAVVSVATLRFCTVFVRGWPANPALVLFVVLPSTQSTQCCRATTKSRSESKCKGLS